ncbi:MAG: hypothetical protein J0H82_18665 [Alphaproteobacteria bacterium]|nr:hypothetical protein [Alphaproteobacteria bacterium]
MPANWIALMLCRLHRVMVAIPVAIITICGTAGAEAATDDDVFEYLTALNAELPKAVEALKSGSMSRISQQSRQFNAIAKRGQMFGSSIFDAPYGSCFATGVAIQHWWQTQVDAAARGGKEAIPNSGRDAWNTFQQRQASCMKAAGIESKTQTLRF